jgi:hypothetical protein
MEVNKPPTVETIATSNLIEAREVKVNKRE